MVLISQKCLICNGNLKDSDKDYYDDRYGYPGLFNLRKCEKCNHTSLNCEFSSRQLTDLYTNYYPRSTFHIKNFRPYLESKGISAWLEGDKGSPFRWIPKKVKILDIGCGFGESLAYHTARNCEVYGVEADENIRKVAEKFGFKVYIGLFDSIHYESNFFDYVTMSQVIEHVQDPLKTLSDIEKVLKPGGRAILSTPNASSFGAKLFGRFWINWHVPYHIQFFTKNSMRLAAEQAGLILENIVTVTPSSWLHFQLIHLLTYPAEAKQSIFWVSRGNWSLKQKIILKFLLVIHWCKINHLITRLLDALKVGDNRIYFLRKP